MIIGIDTNTKYFAVAAYERDADGVPNFYVINEGVTGRLASERIPKLFLATKDFFIDRDVREVWVEDYAFVGGSRATAEVAQCVQAVKDACILCGIPCYPLQNTLWKKEIIGAGNASKEQIREFLILHYGVADNIEPVDCYDAFGVLQAGLRRLPKETLAPQKKKR